MYLLNGQESQILSFDMDFPSGIQAVVQWQLEITLPGHKDPGPIIVDNAIMQSLLTSPSIAIILNLLLLQMYTLKV